jgi:GT2 family glycosyltransferase
VEASNFLEDKINFEIIVIANAPTKKEVEAFENLNKEKWFRYVEVPRESVFASINRGVDLAKGDVVGLWNVDDVRFPEALIDSDRLFKNNIDIVYFPFIIKWYLNLIGINFLIKRKIIKPPLFDKKKFTSEMHCGPFFLFRKDFYKQVGPFDEQFKISGDLDWCIRAAKISDKFVLSEKDGGVFRVDGGGLSAGRKKQHLLEDNIIKARHHLSNELKNFSAKEFSGFKINMIQRNNNFTNYL